MTNEQLGKELAFNEAKRSLEVLKDYARKYCINPECVETISDSKLISSGLSAIINHDTDLSLEIAGDLVEDVDYRDLAEIIRQYEPYVSGTFFVEYMR